MRGFKCVAKSVAAASFRVLEGGSLEKEVVEKNAGNHMIQENQGNHEMTFLKLTPPLKIANCSTSGKPQEWETGFCTPPSTGGV